MTFKEILDAKNEARRTIRDGDRAARELADYLVGRLRVARVDGDVCAILKRELRDFNIHTGCWKEKT